MADDNNKGADDQDLKNNQNGQGGNFDNQDDDQGGNNQDDDQGNQDDDQDDDDQGDDQESDEDKLSRLQRQLARHQKKMGIDPTKDKGNKSSRKDGKNSPADKKGELDYGQKAFLVANGIKTPDEMAIVQNAMKYTGETLEEVLANDFVMGKIKTLRDEKATKAAMPRGNGNRGGNSAQNEVEYWIAKGELPPNKPEFTKLRRAVVNEKARRAKDGTKFAS